MSIILYIDGSPESATAASFAISLAKLMDEELIAQAVIDRDAVLRFTGFHGCPGLCGSGVFLKAYEEIIAALVSVSDSVLMSLTAHAEGRGLTIQTHVDIGDTLSILTTLISQSDSALLIGGSDENLALFKGHEFACPAFIITGQNVGLSEVIMLGQDERSELIAKLLCRDNPDVPVKSYNRYLR